MHKTQEYIVQEHYNTGMYFTQKKNMRKNSKRQESNYARKIYRNVKMGKVLICDRYSNNNNKNNSYFYFFEIVIVHLVFITVDLRNNKNSLPFRFLV